MSVAANSSAPQSESNAEKSLTFEQSVRETIESVAVAFILAFLFRAFVAEAFVIPTGSMAPTLMGAHKDIVCEHCGQQYQAGASSEFDADSGRYTGVLTIGSTCSVCRGINDYNFRANANHASFSGDRILVSKFDYVLHKPERWDVFVFKYYEKARMNYIKRLVGLPGEQILLRGGDVYVSPLGTEAWTIARKPPFKIKAMRQLVADTARRPAPQLEAGWPSLWQPLRDGDTSWQIENDLDQWSAAVTQPTSDWTWLRYYHNFVTEDDWLRWMTGDAIPVPSPKASRLITDYLAYNSSFRHFRDSFYDKKKLRSKVTNETTAMDLVLRDAKEVVAMRGGEIAEALGRVNVTREDGPINDGLHWVGDLLGEFLVEVNSDSGSLSFELVEFGVQFRCTIDVSTGTAKVVALDNGQSLPIFDGKTELTAQTSLRGKGSYRVEFANFDDELTLWVNGSVVPFDQPAVFDSYAFREEKERRPFWNSSEPLDAAPVGVGVQNAAINVVQAKVYRDLYYIALSTQQSEYNANAGSVLTASMPDNASRNISTTAEAIAEIHSHPEWWENTPLFSLRNENRFDIEADQFLPLGDNSAASADGRAWDGHHYIEARYLLGKALLVFWPHTWNTPVPFTPNFSRMGLIR